MHFLSGPIGQRPRNYSSYGCCSSFFISSLKGIKWKKFFPAGNQTGVIEQISYALFRLSYSDNIKHKMESYKFNLRHSKTTPQTLDQSS